MNLLFQYCVIQTANCPAPFAASLTKKFVSSNNDSLVVISINASPFIRATYNEPRQIEERVRISYSIRPVCEVNSGASSPNP